MAKKELTADQKKIVELEKKLKSQKTYAKGLLAENRKLQKQLAQPKGRRVYGRNLST